MAYFLPHLHTAYAVDRAIQDETEKLVVIRFGHDNDRQCMLVRLQIDGITSSKTRLSGRLPTS